MNNIHSGDLTQQNEQHTQQTEGEFEFGQQTIGNQHHSEDLTQQNEQHTQQTEGEFEFGQQTIGNQHHSEDLTQQNEQHTQQTEGEFEFGQQTIGNQHHSEDLTQQNEQHTQQIEGEFEFGQQTIGNQHHSEDLTQQNEQHTQQVEEFHDYDDFRQQTSGKLEFGQQTVDQHVNNHHLEDLTQQNEQFTQHAESQFELGQQTIGHQHSEDLAQQNEQFTQQTEDKFKLGQLTVNNQNSKHLTQKIEQLAQQTAKSDDLIQRTTGTLEFGQRTVNDHHPKNLIQKDKFTQQTESQLEFGQHAIDNQYSDDLTQQKNEQFTQGFDDLTQQMSGKLEFGQQAQPIDKSKLINQHFEKFGQQNEDLTQQTGKFDEFTQQTMGRLEFGQESQEFDKPKIRNQYLEDFIQKDKDLNQQIEGLEHWQLQQASQKMDLNQDFTQQNNHDQSITDMTKSAPKPRLRQRYQKHHSTSQYIDGTHANLNVFKMADVDNDPKEIIQHTSQVQHSNINHGKLEILNQQSQGSSVFDNQKENMDRLHWIHKSNDATLGLQWHYTYHPSDLTNVQGAHDSYYPHHNINSQQTENLQQQSRPFDFSQQETQHTFENSHLNLNDPQISQHNKNNQQSESIQQIETSHFSNQQNKNLGEIPLGVIPLQHNQDMQQTTELDKQSQSTTQTEYKLEPRILQAYGGGPYDRSRNEDIYNRITINPSATLPPIDGEDPWDIREKPRYMIPWTAVNTKSTPENIITTEMVETTTQMIQNTSEEAPPSFWNRLGHKISNTYDKAKEKAKEIFG